jgi:hypothetical protein
LARSGSAWSVKGIDADTRAIARSRAGDAAITIGAWIDQAILAHAQAPGRAGSDQPANDEQTTTRSPIARSHDGPDRVSNQDLLDLIDQELEASRGRLDESLKPTGFALKNLALRLVAAEALRRGKRPKGDLELPALSRGPDPNGPNTIIAPVSPMAPTPPVQSLAPFFDPDDFPNPTRNLPARDLPAPPSPPSGNLNARIATIDDPFNQSQPTRDPTASLGRPGSEILPSSFNQDRPVPTPPTTSMVTIDPAEMPTPAISAVPSRSLAPDVDLDPPARGAEESDTQRSESSPEIRRNPGVQFLGVQSGYESDPDIAVVEARASSGRTALRALRIAASLVPIFIISGLGAGYFLAEPLGIVPLRDQATKQFVQHATSAEKTLVDAYHGAKNQFDNLVNNQGPSPGAAPSVPSSQTPKLASNAKADPELPGKRQEEKKQQAASTSGSVTPPMTPSVENNGKPRLDPRPTARLGVSTDDPSIANLGVNNAQNSVNKPVVTKRPAKTPRLAAAPPIRPVVPETTRPPVQKAKPRTRLAALPKAPRIQENTIPSSKLDGEAVLSTLRTGARAGDPRAQHELARRLIQGDGVARDYEEGSEWFREAAIQGMANAQYNLAVLYERGLGVTKDDVRALLWYHSAAEQSHPLAQYNLGIFYLQGRGIPLSYAEAVRWFTSASKQGVARATYNLAVLTEDGLGVSPDRDKAIALYEKASSSGHHEATSRLSVLRDPKSTNPKPATFEETADTQAEGESTGTTVADIQAFLRLSGIYKGRIDGIAGPKTRTAIREYQQRHALPITGIPSDFLLDFMKASAGSTPKAASASG